LRQPYTPRSPVFLGLPAGALAVLDTSGTYRFFEAKTEVYRQGDGARYLYRVLEGRINLVAASVDGREMIVRVMYPGDLLGLSAVISRGLYEVTASVVIKSRIQAIPSAVFLDLLENRPEAMACVARALADEYLDIVERAQILHLNGSTPARLARVLLECAPGDNATSPFQFLFTHTEVANMVGCSRESVSRTFGSFRRNHFINISGATITILQPGSLLNVGRP
jgi:CRP/FNR family transcriptional regulator, cyclic AMP receptor protein